MPGNGMDPVVFGMQISAHLERAAAERAAAGPPIHVRRAAAPHVVPGEAVEPRAQRPGMWDTADWGDVLSAMEEEIEGARLEPGAPVVEPAPTDLEHPAIALAEDTGEAPSVARAIDLTWRAPVEAAPPMAAAPATVDPPAVPAPPAPAAVPRTKRMRRVPPQDEFGFFDPRQCGLSALFAKLNAIDDAAAKKPA